MAKLDPYRFLDALGRATLRAMEAGLGRKCAWDVYFSEHPDFYFALWAFAGMDSLNPSRSIFDAKRNQGGDGDAGR